MVAGRKCLRRQRQGDGLIGRRADLRMVAQVCPQALLAHERSRADRTCERRFERSTVAFGHRCPLARSGRRLRLRALLDGTTSAINATMLLRHVRREIALKFTRISAQRAFERFARRVRAQMIVQHVTPIGSVRADRTIVHLLLCDVSSLVLVEQLLRLRFEVALSTLVTVRVLIVNVLLQGALQLGAIVAVIARERPRVRMYTLVSLQVRVEREVGAANGAAVRRVAGVRPHVYVQLTRVAARVRAQVTFVWPNGKGNGGSRTGLDFELHLPIARVRS